MPHRDHLDAVCPACRLRAHRRFAGNTAAQKLATIFESIPQQQFFRASGESNCLSSSDGWIGYAHLVVTAQPGDRSWISSLRSARSADRRRPPDRRSAPLPHGDDVMKANGGLSRDPAMLGTSGYALRPNGQYFTPTWVTEALLSRVGFRGVIWEPAAGAGDMVKPLRVAGYRVFASELHGPDLGCADAVRLDFLEAHSLPDGVCGVRHGRPSWAAQGTAKRILRR